MLACIPVRLHDESNGGPRNSCGRNLEPPPAVGIGPRSGVQRPNPDQGARDRAAVRAIDEPPEDEDVAGRDLAACHELPLALEAKGRLGDGRFTA